MQVISALSKIKELQGIIRSAEETSQTEDSQGENNSSDFATYLRGVIKADAANNVSEEELFAGLVGERLKKLKGEESATKFNELLATHKNTTRAATGYVPMEDAAKNALKELRDAGELSAEEANKIYSESFSAAQLDSNTGALFDGRGEENDPTIAVQKMDAALISAQLLIDKYDSGEASADVRSLDEASNSIPVTTPSTLPSTFDSSYSGSLSDLDGSDELGDFATGGAALPLSMPSGNTFDGPNGFLFKPISSNEGTLAVLLPESLAHKVTKLLIKDSSGNIVEEGRSTGYGELGTREKFAFRHEGKDYPDNIVVEARLADGSVRQFAIPDPAQRYD